MINADLPLGFGMALAQHPHAMDRFAHMTNADYPKSTTSIQRKKCKAL